MTTNELTNKEFALTAMSIEQKMREKHSNVFNDKEKNLISNSIIAFYILQTRYDDKMVDEFMNKMQTWINESPFPFN